MPSPRLLLPVLAASLTTVHGFAADAALEARLPLKPEIRKIFDNSCVMCHGEVINGEKEIRGDLDLSNDDEIRATLVDLGKFKQNILEDKMPQKPRLSRRLRNDTAAQERLKVLRENYDKHGEKAVLLEWLHDIVASKGEDKAKKE